MQANSGGQSIEGRIAFAEQSPSPLEADPIKHITEAGAFMAQLPVQGAFTDTELLSDLSYGL
ncbi:hypothetical protein MA04_00432 [Alcanivorax balearicus MACL04]|uniref:Uncharacterized protein n=1 Tax=Alloalcanivorax balearicus MACL04 TaxID=1177182 RepID=A0ABT2QUF8_9GAMM|nr:hypothetical protein [Alloalcanivorax balearicus MACL04]